MARVTWSPSTLDDINAIAEYIARDSVDIAALFVSRLIEAAERLRDFPESGRIIPEISAENCREIIYGAYRMMYRIEGDEVWIISIQVSLC